MFTKVSVVEDKVHLGQLRLRSDPLDSQKVSTPTQDFVPYTQQNLYFDHTDGREKW